MAASLTLAPALLALLRNAIFWPFHAAPGRRRPRALGEPDEVPVSGFWVHAADLVVRHPVAILTVCLLSLLPLAIVGARTRPNYNQLADLDPDRPSVIGSEVIRRHFAVGELSPAAALVDNPPLDFRSERGRAAIAEVSRRLADDRPGGRGPLAHPAGRQAARRAGTGLPGPTHR